MKQDDLLLPELNNNFSKINSFLESDLRDFYRRRLDNFDNNKFRRILYTLQIKDLIKKIDRGTYTLLKNNLPGFEELERFKPWFSAELKQIHAILKLNFPYTTYSIWETNILFEWMIHQPARRMIITDVEKDAVESVFNALSSQYPARVFLDPDRELMETYILSVTDSIIVVPMISRSPVKNVDGIPTPRLEKILVDIFTEADKYFIFHGQELKNIFEGAFGKYKISESRLFAYADRRNVKKKLRNFIEKKTHILLIQSGERAE